MLCGPGSFYTARVNAVLDTGTVFSGANEYSASETRLKGSSNICLSIITNHDGLLSAALSSPVTLGH